VGFVTQKFGFPLLSISVRGSCPRSARIVFWAVGGETFLIKATAFMKFSVFVAPSAVRCDLSAATKDEVIAELVQALVDSGEILAKDKDDIVKAIMRREELGSTGIGRGVAVPHTKHPSVKKLVGTVGVSPTGLDFESLDGQKARLFFLLVSPPDRPGDHLRALENISRQLRDEQFCKILSQSTSAEDILQLLEEADSQQSGN